MSRHRHHRGGVATPAREAAEAAWDSVHPPTPTPWWAAVAGTVALIVAAVAVALVVVAVLRGLWWVAFGWG